MFRWLRNVIARNRTDALTRARQARLRAVQAACDAKARGDTRDLGTARKALRAANHAELRIVVGR